MALRVWGQWQGWFAGPELLRWYTEMLMEAAGGVQGRRKAECELVSEWAGFSACMLTKCEIRISFQD